MEQKFIEMAKVIFTSIDHYRESGRDDKFNIDSIAEYLQRQFLLQQTPCSTALELLEQLMNREQQFVESKELGFEERKQHAKNRYVLLSAMQLIQNLPPMA